MNLVKVTSKLRNGKAFAKDLLIDLDRITEPVYENISNESVISLNETPSLKNHVNQGLNKVQYVINETLAELVDLVSDQIFIGTVIERNGRKPLIGQQAFIAANMVGSISEDPSGSSFQYEEEGDLLPVTYLISEDIDTINESLTSSQVPYKSYVATLAQTGTNAPVAAVQVDEIGLGAWQYFGVGLYAIQPLASVDTTKMTAQGSATITSTPNPTKFVEATASGGFYFVFTSSLDVPILGPALGVLENDALDGDQLVEFRLYD